jgi:hypothetical protein
MDWGVVALIVCAVILLAIALIIFAISTLIRFVCIVVPAAIISKIFGRHEPKDEK